MAAVVRVVSLVIMLAPWVAASGLKAADAAVEGKWEEVRTRTFELVWATVNDSYYDPAFGGVDWTAVRNKYHPSVETAPDVPALRSLLQRMLGELNRSHFAVVPREAAVFTPEERPRVGTIGIELGWRGFGLVVLRMRSGSAAEAAGLRRGDRIKQIGGLEVASISRRLLSGGMETFRRSVYLEHWAQSLMRSPVGSEIILVADRGDGSIGTFRLVSELHPGDWSEPAGNFPSQPIELESAVADDGIAYLRFNVFARELMPRLREFLKSVPADGGLVIDLRGNGGGIAIMAAGLSGWLCDRQQPLGLMLLRQGRMPYVVHPQEGAFTGPVAVLIDSRSASTAEIMAGGLRDAGRVRLFGGRSAGAALPSSFLALPTGDLLQYAIADLVTPGGRSIEGNGIMPDVIVEESPEILATGRDPARENAEDWLRSVLRVRADRRAAR